MELLTIQHIGEAAPRHIITACDDTDTCPSCGAGYQVGMSQCEYCRQALPCIKGDAIDEAPALTAEQVIIKLLRQLRTKAPHYREDVEAIEAGRAWLDGRA